MEIPVLKLSSLVELEEEIKRTREKVRTKRSGSFQPLETLLFRGHSNSEWKLCTTLERYIDQRYSVRSYNNLLDRILPAVETFSGRKWDLNVYNDHRPNPLFFHPPNIDFMVYLRHIGFPSPLLDWSQSLYIALYFAYAGVKENDEISIYTYLDAPQGVKSAIGSESVINLLGPYVTSHRRHFNQQAQYTICTINENNSVYYYSHDKSGSKEIESQQEVIRKYNLPGSLKDEILTKLFEMNINAYSLFQSDETLIEMLAYKEMHLRNYLERE